MSHENNATILQLLPKTNFAFYLTGFLVTLLQGKAETEGGWLRRRVGSEEREKEQRGDNMTCGLLQQTIPIKCDIQDRDNIQMSRVNKNSRWVSWTAMAIKCVKHLRESKVSNLMRWNISDTETKWEIPERYPSYDASECCFAKVFSNVSSTFEVPLQHCAAC